MADDDWGDLDLESERRETPLWAWLLGAGCLVAALLFGAVAFLGWRVATTGKDVELQWSLLEQVLPHDERPAGWEMIFGIDLRSAESWVLRRPGQEDPDAPGRGALYAFLVASSDGSSLRIDPDPRHAPQGAEAIALELQGRVLEGYRVEEGEDTPWPSFTDSKPGTMLVLELTEPGDERRLVFVLRQPTLEPVALDDARAFLTPFHIGPDRPR